MKEMTIGGYCRYKIAKFYEEQAAKEGIKIVDKKSKPTVVVDNVASMRKTDTIKED